MPLTYVVADALNLYQFDQSVPFRQVSNTLSRLFQLAPKNLGHLINGCAKARPDLLIAGVDRNKMQLKVNAGNTGLDPCSSSLIRHVVEALGLVECWRKLTLEGGTDEWLTPRAQMCGGVPLVLYHGTCDIHLASIRAIGLSTTGVPNWKSGGRNQVYMTASPQIAAFHARHTANSKGGQPIVVACRRPAKLLPDWDVINSMVKSPAVPSNDGQVLAREAGLFASPIAIPACEIVEIRTPKLSSDYLKWPIV